VLHAPPILFLDEPTSGVDPVARRHFWELIHDLAAQGMTLLITTHFMDEAEFCDRLGFINAGRLIALDTPAGIKRQTGTTSLEEAFISLAGRKAP
jgi:ABC-type multidrug transport system ATPase subunit